METSEVSGLEFIDEVGVINEMFYVLVSGINHRNGFNCDSVVLGFNHDVSAGFLNKLSEVSLSDSFTLDDVLGMLLQGRLARLEMNASLKDRVYGFVYENYIGRLAQLEAGIKEQKKYVALLDDDSVKRAGIKCDVHEARREYENVILDLAGRKGKAFLSVSVNY